MNFKVNYKILIPQNYFYLKKTERTWITPADNLGQKLFTTKKSP
jgi:hypothetical protein